MASGHWSWHAAVSRGLLQLSEVCVTDAGGAHQVLPLPRRPRLPLPAVGLGSVRSHKR